MDHRNVSKTLLPVLALRWSNQIIKLHTWKLHDFLSESLDFTNTSVGSPFNTMMEAIKLFRPFALASQALSLQKHTKVPLKSIKEKERPNAAHPILIDNCASSAFQAPWGFLNFPLLENLTTLTNFEKSRCDNKVTLNCSTVISNLRTTC